MIIHYSSMYRNSYIKTVWLRIKKQDEHKMNNHKKLNYKIK